MKRLAALGIVSLSLLTPASVAFAQDEAPKIATISVGNERYVAGESVTISQNIPGDLTVMGGRVSVNAIVSGSVQAVGGDVTFENLVRGNVRAAGGTVTIAKTINGNLVVAGGTVRIEPAAIIGGSVLVLGGDIIIDGTVNGKLTVKGGTVSMNGTVRGEADIRSESLAMEGRVMGNAIISTKNLTLGQTASFSKNLTYWTLTGEQNYASVVRGKATYDATLARKDVDTDSAPAVITSILAAVTIYSLLSAALVILVMMLLTKTFFRDSAKILHARPGMSFLTGLIYFIAAPLLAFILVVTLIGIPFGIAVIFGFVMSIIFAKALTAIIFARLLEIKFKKKWSDTGIFFLSLLLFVALKVLNIIPVIGWIVCMVAVFFAFGALIRAKYDRYLKVR